MLFSVTPVAAASARRRLRLAMSLVAAQLAPPRCPTTGGESASPTRLKLDAVPVQVCLSPSGLPRLH